MSDWSPAEDLRPAMQMTKQQPEKNARGLVWTQLVAFNWPAPGWTYMTIRDCAGDVLIGHGRVWPLPKDEEDGA